jgi:hypothetical protein
VQFAGYPLDSRLVGRGLFLLAAATMALVVGGGTGRALGANAFPPSSSWQTNGTVRAIVFHGNVMYVGGQFTSVRPPGAAAGTGEVARNNVAAFSAVTGALLKWNPNVNGAVRAIAVNSTRVYLGGSFTSVGGRARKNLAAVTFSGAVARWNPGANRSVFALRVGPNGNIFAGGDFGKVHGRLRRHIAEIGISSASPVAAWAPSIGQITGFACPPRCSPRVFTIAFSQNNKRVYFGGHFGLVDGVARDEIASVPLNDGSKVLAFNPNVYAPANCPTCTTVETSRVYHIIVTAGSIYTCGGYWKVNGSPTSYNVSAFDPNTGKLQTSFTGQDDGDTPGCGMLKGIMYVGGHFNVAGPNCKPSNLGPCQTRHHIAALDTTHNSLLPWNPGANSNHGVFVVGVGGGRVAFGGYFTRVGGKNQQGIALFQASHLAS